MVLTQLTARMSEEHIGSTDDPSFSAERRRCQQLTTCVAWWDIPDIQFHKLLAEGKVTERKKDMNKHYQPPKEVGLALLYAGYVPDRF